MRELYRTFDKLAVDTARTGYVLLDNGETLELQYFSLYSDDADTVTFLKPTETFHANSNWNDEMLSKLIGAIDSGTVTVAGTYASDDKNLPQYRYNNANLLVAYGVKIYKPIRDAFRNACKNNGETQSEVITRLMLEYTNNS